MIIKKTIEYILDELEERHGNHSFVSGITTGFSRLDTLTSGLNRGQLITICGVAGVGKTAFALNMARNMSIQANANVVIKIPLTSKFDIGFRLLCAEGLVDASKIKSSFLSRDDWDKITHAAGVLADSRIMLTNDEINPDFEIDALVIDSFQAIKEEKGLYAYDYIRELKDYALKKNIVIILTSSLDDWELRKRHNKRPILTDFKYYEAALPDLSDLVIGIYRDELYNDDENNPNRGTAEISILKNSFGPTGMAMLTYLKEYTLFEDFTCE